MSRSNLGIAARGPALIFPHLGARLSPIVLGRSRGLGASPHAATLGPDHFQIPCRPKVSLLDQACEHDRDLQLPVKNASLTRCAAACSQYTALTFGAELRRHGIEPSMGRVKTCYDNTVAESFFATLKKNLVNRYSWPTRHDAQTAIFDFIARWYNNLGLHSTLGYVSPAGFEQLTQAVS
ncbi:MAG: family transposase [Thermoleophilia bacterium]|nr:family transposase [Thermoleophilia bacterium]